MKKAMQVLAGSSVFAILVGLALAGVPAQGETNAMVPGSGQDRGMQHLQGISGKAATQKNRLAGVWDAKVVITDCSSGNPTGDPFDALGVFERDGSFHDTNANNPTLMMRSDAFGYWEHIRGNKYRFAFKLFNFDVSGAYLGYQIIRHDLIMARDGKNYRSEGGAEFFNPDGTPRVPVRVCSETTGTRFR
jgi:hypothetical protein